MFRFQRSVYLDNNATSAVSARVRRAVDRVLRTQYGNPSGSYGLARAAAAVLQDSRERVALTINAEAEEIFFTSGASEANNQVLRSLTDLSFPEKRRILSTPIEHPSIMKALEFLEENGVEVDMLPVDAEGRVSIESVAASIRPDTFLLCCMLANNEIGTIQDLASISSLARSRGVPVLCDCVQALGKIPVDVRALGVDYASFSAHKLHGPKGVGALYVRSGSAIAPLVHGGHQEAGLRAGTEPVHNIAGFAEACRAVPELLASRKTIESRRSSLLAELKALRPDLVVNTPEAGSLPNTLSLRFPGVSNVELMAILDLNGISVSVGSACSTGETTPSHVLVAIGLTEKEADETLRLSFSEQTSEREIRHVVRVFQDYFEGKAPSIPLIRPSQMDESFIGDEDNYLLDIRFEIERKLMKGLPNSHNASVIAFERYVHAIPKDKNIIVVCSTGIDATPIAYSLHKRGYARVAILFGGIVGWQLQQPKLYRRLGNLNATRIPPRRRGAL